MSPISAIQPAKGEALITSAFANTAGKVSVTWETGPRPKPVDPVLRKAVLQYIKTVRSLGKTSINTSDIAEALGISKMAVMNVLPYLEKNGVKR